MTVSQLRAVPLYAAPSVLERMRQALPRFSVRRVGGLTFIRLGRFSMSYCITR